MAKKKTTSNSTPIEATVHKKDKRANIPTEELRDFVAEDETKPKMILYPRDPRALSPRGAADLALSHQCARSFRMCITS